MWHFEILIKDTTLIESCIWGARKRVFEKVPRCLLGTVGNLQPRCGDHLEAVVVVVSGAEYHATITTSHRETTTPPDHHTHNTITPPTSPPTTPILPHLWVVWCGVVCGVGVWFLSLRDFHPNRFTEIRKPSMTTPVQGSHHR